MWQMYVPPSTLQDVTVAAHGDGVATALERNGRAWRALYLGTYSLQVALIYPGGPLTMLQRSSLAYR